MSSSLQGLDGHVAADQAQEDLRHQDRTVPAAQPPPPPPPPVQPQQAAPSAVPEITSASSTPAPVPAIAPTSSLARQDASNSSSISFAPPATAAGAVDDVTASHGHDDDPESYEQEHVHSVYESIASHFSATRYKPWPVIASFLTGLAPGSVGIDVGCGNGKYLGVNPAVHILGSDRSAKLVRIARDHGERERGQDVAVADGLSLPYPRGRADFAICVAVIHHMSTRDRRREAVSALLDCVRPGSGRVLVYVWALEQAGSRRGWDEGADQDQLVPWVFKAKPTPTKKKKQQQQQQQEPAAEVDGATAGDTGTDTGAGAGAEETTYQRYYHLYRKGELEEDVLAVGGRVVESGYDKDNWWAVASRDQ